MGKKKRPLPAQGQAREKKQAPAEVAPVAEQAEPGEPAEAEKAERAETTQAEKESRQIPAGQEQKKAGGPNWKLYAPLAAGALLLVLSLCCLVITITMASRLKAQDEGLSKLSASLESFESKVEEIRKATVPSEEEGETREDDVVIAENYTITSTLPISDAYRSGSDAGLTDKQKETLQMASEILEEVITENMTDLEKETAVYRWMTSHLAEDSGMLPVVPTAGADSDNPYGVLKYHTAVCVGYATTFRLFMQMLGIDCKVVHNRECYHSWDLVSLNGNWYHVDIYSDVGTDSMTHFNLNDSMQATEQDWDIDYFPAATSLECNPMWQERVEVDGISDVPQAVRQAIEEKKSLLLLTFRTPVGETAASAVWDSLNALSEQLMAHYMEGDFPEGLNEYSWLAGEGENELMLRIVFGDYPGGSDGSGNLAILDRMNQEMISAFEDILPDVDYYVGAAG